VFSALSFALARTKSPTRETETALSDAAFREPDSARARTAQLMLGAVAHEEARVDPERAGRTVDQLIRFFEGMHSPDAARRLLSVLGNAGSPRGLPFIGRYLRDPSPEMRRGAVAALRFVEGARAEELLTEASADPEASVRLATIAAMGYRQMTGQDYAVLRRMVLGDAAEKVRLAALRRLWEERATYSGAGALAREVAEHDGSESVRQAAAEMSAGG
jgi:HEAT repeat protein